MEEKIIRLLKKRRLINKEIEENMYVDCGPSNEDFMQSFEIERKIKIEESKIILNYYRDIIGKLAKTNESLESLLDECEQKSIP
tara:strand:+ start:529 stop:780 length:252 start_codon:yes stop_codon:yes gene_type:complete